MLSEEDYQSIIQDIIEVSDLVTKRLELDKELRQIITSSSESISRSDMDKTIKDKYQKKILALELENAKILILTLEDLNQIEARKLLNAFDSVSSRASLTFGSTEDAKQFARVIQSLIRALNAYSSLAVLDDMLKEKKMFEDYGRLISDYLEYTYYRQSNSLKQLSAQVSDPLPFAISF